MAKKKYSYTDRVKYHSEKVQSFTDSFRKKSKSGFGTTLDFEAMIAAEKKQPKIQYSGGYSQFAFDIGRGHVMPENELKQETKAFQRGFKAAKAAYEKSRNIKF